MREPLTPRLKQALDFIASYIKEHGYPPAYRELHKNPSNAQRMVDELVARGHLRRTAPRGCNRKYRNIVLLYDSDDVPNWEGIALALSSENKFLREQLRMAGIHIAHRELST